MQGAGDGSVGLVPIPKTDPASEGTEMYKAANGLYAA